MYLLKKKLIFAIFLTETSTKAEDIKKRNKQEANTQIKCAFMDRIRVLIAIWQKFGKMFVFVMLVPKQQCGSWEMSLLFRLPTHISP